MQAYQGRAARLAGVGRGNSPTVESVRGLASTSGNGGAEKRRGWSSIRSDGGVTWGGELADDGEPRGRYHLPLEDESKRDAMGDAGTPRGLSSTEDGGPSTQRGEPFGTTATATLAAVWATRCPAPDVAMRIGSEAGNAAAFTATAALSSLRPCRGKRAENHASDEARSRPERPSFTASQLIIGPRDADRQSTLGRGGFPPGALSIVGFTTSSATYGWSIPHGHPSVIVW